MSKQLGKCAVVVGCGMGGLAASGALSPHFDEVLVLERDELPADPEQRTAIPQGRHVHALLAGGQRALGGLFPGFENRLAAAGAVSLRVGLDLSIERLPFDEYPRRDLGFSTFALSRPLVEVTLRRSALENENVEIRSGCTVQALEVSARDHAVTGLTYRHGGRDVKVDADLVIDASARAELTLSALAALSLPRPRTSVIGVDIGYSTAVFEIPEGGTSNWQGVMTFPDPAKSTMGALMLPMEDNRWILSVGGRGTDRPPGEPEAFLEHVAMLRTRTIFAAVSKARRIGDIARFGFTESRHFHYEELDRFPRGLVPLGDALCQINPVYGQGMSMAAQQAATLRDLLSELSSEADPLGLLWRSYFERSAGVVEGPWFQAAIPDFIYPDTRGGRPDNLKMLLKIGMALHLMGAEDENVHRLVLEVAHLLKPRSAYMETPGLMDRVLERARTLDVS